MIFQFLTLTFVNSYEARRPKTMLRTAVQVRFRKANQDSLVKVGIIDHNFGSNSSQTMAL